MKAIPRSMRWFLSHCGNTETSTELTKSNENTEHTTGNENNGFEMRASHPTFKNVNGNKIQRPQYDAINEG